MRDDDLHISGFNPAPTDKKLSRDLFLLENYLYVPKHKDTVYLRSLVDRFYAAREEMLERFSAEKPLLLDIESGRKGKSLCNDHSIFLHDVVSWKPVDPSKLKSRPVVYISGSPDSERRLLQ